VEDGPLGAALPAHAREARRGSGHSAHPRTLARNARPDAGASPEGERNEAPVTIVESTRRPKRWHVRIAFKTSAQKHERDRQPRESPFPKGVEGRTRKKTAPRAHRVR